ncbi:MAG: hypothetical protein N2C12_15160, partial [Planctomycetales bacterium]
ALKEAANKTVDEALSQIKTMTLTVVDGDFPREVLAGQNLSFAEYHMPRRRNNVRSYDANRKGPSEKKDGILKLGALTPASSLSTMQVSNSFLPIAFSLAAIGIVLIHLACSRSQNQIVENSTDMRKRR